MRLKLQNMNLSCMNSILHDSNYLSSTLTHPNFETLNPTISVNDLVIENNKVFPLYASNDRKHQVNLLMISNSEGKLHYLLVRDLSALVHGRTKYHGYTHVWPYCLYCFSEARLLTAHLLDCSVHPEQKVEYPSPDDPEKNIKKFKAIATRKASIEAGIRRNVICYKTWKEI